MRGLFAGAVGAVLPLFAANVAYAAGFAISDKSVSSMGVAFAGQTALAENASTVYTNPAGMVQLSGSHVSVAVHRLRTSAEFTDDGNSTAGSGDNDVDVDVVIPNFYYVTELSPDVRAGFGFNSPFGLGLDYDPQWSGRYFTIESKVRTFNLSPAIAFRASPKLAIGVSLDAQYLDAELYQAVDFGTLCAAYETAGAMPAGTCTASDLQPQQDDGTQRLTGDNWSYGFSLGVSYAFSEATRMGAVVHSAVRHDISGDSDFEQVPAIFAGSFSDSSGSLTTHLPEIVSFSLSHAANERLTLLADYTFTRWSRFDELRVRFDNGLPDSVSKEEWNDSSRYAIGAHYRLTPAWLLRAGFSYDETPVPDAEHRSPRVPDADRRWYTVGANWVAAPGLTLDVAYAYVAASNIPIDRRDGLGHRLSGTYDAAGSFLSLQANWAF